MAEELDAEWEVTVSVPLRLPEEQREALFDAVADAVAEWEPDDRTDWDAMVSAHPETFALLLWLHAEAVWERDLLAAHTVRAGIRQNEGRRELARIASSRQAWAEEAMRLDCIAESVLTAVSKYDDKLRFMARRYLSNGPGLNFRPTRCSGVSSDAMAWFAVGMRDEPRREEYPLDPSDLAACERTYEMAPEFLRERMEPVLARYRAAVAKSYPEVGPRPQCAVHPGGTDSYRPAAQLWGEADGSGNRLGSATGANPPSVLPEETP